MKSIHQKIKDAGIPWEGYYSDLYVPVNDITKELISGYEYKMNVTIFISQIDKKQWYDIPFANEDYKRFKR